MKFRTDILIKEYGKYIRLTDVINMLEMINPNKESIKKLIHLLERISEEK